MNDLDVNCSVNSRSKSIVRSEKGKSIRLKNDSKSLVKIWKVDGCLISEGERCDYAFECFDVNVFCELKGNDLRKAVRQLVRSTELLAPKFKSDKNIGLIVSRRCPLAGTDMQIEMTKKQDLIKKLNLIFEQKNLEIEVCKKFIADCLKRKSKRKSKRKKSK